MVPRGAAVTDDDLAFVQWSGRRYRWLNRFAYRRSVWKPLRVAACEGVALAIRLERKVWLLMRRPGRD